MYAVLLAAMMTAGGQQAEGWGWRSSCHGCYGSCYGSCSGSCYGSCYGGCHGCWGSHSHVYYWGCSGCCGGCCGGSCYGSCYGCNGFTGYSVGYTYWASGCYGSSCFGGCYGCAGGIGCYGWTGGAVSGPVTGAVEYSAPVVGSVAPPTSGSPSPAPVTPPPVSKQGDKAPMLPDIAPPPGKGNENAINTTAPRGIATVSANNSQTTARVVVFIPADAKLWVDNVACPLTGDTRSFNTPALQPGAQYAYTITMETPEGRRENRRVTMTAGNTVEVDFRPNVESVAR